MDSTRLATFVASAQQLLMQRLDRLSVPVEKARYFEMRVRQSIAELERQGIKVSDTSVDDLMLVVDLAAWNHANRDKPGEQPTWLRTKIRGRWVNDDPR